MTNIKETRLLTEKKIKNQNISFILLNLRFFFYKKEIGDVNFQLFPDRPEH
jgi:hypothetical protein